VYRLGECALVEVGESRVPWKGPKAAAEAAVQLSHSRDNWCGTFRGQRVQDFEMPEVQDRMSDVGYRMSNVGC
jgi:hypothetical protein